MKKVSFLAVLLLFSVTMFCSEWIPLKSGKPEKARLTLVSEREGETVLELTIPGYFAEEVEVEGKPYAYFTLEGCANMMEKGSPSLPFIAADLAIGDSGEVSVSVKEEESGIVEVKDYLPSKGHFTRNMDPETIPYSFSEVYAAGGFFPPDPVDAETPFILRNIRGVNLKFTPFQYDPVSGKMKIISRLLVTVRTTGGDGENILSRKMKVRESREFIDIYRERFLNFGLFSQRYTAIGEAGRLLIITYDSFYDAMLPFLRWKLQKGIPSEMVRLSDIGTTAAQVQAYIQNYYSTKGVTYILLVGDSGQMPYLQGTVGNVTGEASDPRYGLLAGSDNYPEAFVSRFPAQTATQVSTMVNRVINYEKTPDAPADWYHKAFGIGGDDEGGTGLADWERIELLKDELLAPAYNYTVFDEIYHDPGSASQVTSSINGGRSLGVYIGHGSETSWGTTGFNTANINALTNTGMTPLVYSVACLNGRFNYSSDCFGETWQKAGTPEAPTGAIACYASSTNQSWVPPCDAQTASVEMICADTFHSVGAICVNGCMAGMDLWDATEAGQLYQQWHIFGDASTMIFTDTPSAMTVDHGGTIVIPQDSYSVTVNGVEGALCALYDETGNILRGHAYTNSSGVAVITLDPPPASPATLQLTVTAFNRMPFFGTVSVMAANGPYFVYSSHGALTEVEGDGDSYLERGEKWSVSVSMGNIGTEGATGAVATLSGNGIEVCVPSRSFGNISVGGTGSATFEFVISEGFAPCGGEVVFGLISKACAESSPAGSDQGGIFSVAVGQLTAGQATDLVIQPSPSDTHIAQDASGTNYGTSATMHVQRLTNGGRRALVQFDLSGIPQGSMINSAQLELYCTSPSSVSQTLNLHNVNASWTETGATWSNMNSKYDGAVLSSRTGGTAMGWKSWTGLSGLVQDWIDGDIPNYGVMVKTSVETGTTAYAYQFASSEHGTAANRPILRVNYTPPDVWDCAYSGGSECDALFAPSGEVAETEVTPTGFGWNATDAQSYRVLRGVQSNLPALETADADFSCYSFGAATSVNISADDPSGEPGMCYYYLVQGYNGPDPDMYFGPAGNSTAGPRVINTQSACD